MKKYIHIILIVFSLVLIAGNNMGASYLGDDKPDKEQKEKDKEEKEKEEKEKKEKKEKKADLDNWTEEQICHWEDSIMNDLFPQPEIGRKEKPDKPDKKAPVLKAISGVSVYAGNNTYVPNSVTIDKNKAVGEIPIATSISATGATTYTVPIEIYPGVRGFQPQIALGYNSLSGNGIVGVGWNVSGISKITRAGKSIYYDGKSEGICMTKGDAFILDGMRLIKTSETTSEIRFESETGNIKVKALLNGNVVRYFEVYYPNGYKGIFGYSTNYADYLEYPLTSFSDLRNNTINFNYSFENNHYIISNIVYGGASNASIEFQYQSTRTDVITAYAGGLKVIENKLLQKINCKFGTTILRSYDLTYQPQKSASALKMIACTASGVSLNPIQLYYGENNTATTYTKGETQLMEWYIATTPGQIRLSKGKFDYGTDNDGVISLPNNTSYWYELRIGLGLKREYKNKYTGSEKIFLYAGLNQSSATPLPNLLTEANFIDIFCANVDGKYEEEVVKVNNGISGTYDQVNFNVYSANFYTGLTKKYTRTFNFPPLPTNSSGGRGIHPKFYHTGDFNGDGKMEVLAVSCHNPLSNTAISSKCYLFDLDANTKLFEGYAFPYYVNFVGSGQGDGAAAAQNTDRLFPLDYDGDGKTDICHINNEGTHIYTFDISGSTYSMRKVATYTGLKKADLDGRELLPGEFNGDGKPDLLLSPREQASDWFIFNAMGNGQFEKIPTSITYRIPNHTLTLQDVNSDGLTDLIDFNGGTIHTFTVNNCNQFKDEGYTFNNAVGLFLVPTNINSRSYFHQLIALKDNVATRFAFPRNDTKEKMLTGVVNSMGIVNKNYYRMLNESGTDASSYDFYTKGSGATYPYENFQGPFFVTEKSETYFNGQLTGLATTGYANAVIHKQGLGFRGFEKITTTDNVRNRTTTQVFDPYNYGVMKSDNSPFAQNSYNYSVSVQPNKTVKIRLNSRSSSDKLKGITISSSYQYDTYGNPTQEVINYGGGITATTTSTYSHNTNDAGYLIGFLTDQTTSTNRNGAVWSNRTNIPSFSSAQPDAVVKYANGSQVSKEAFSYDAKGNILSKTNYSYSSSVGLKTTYTYDSYGRLTLETSPLGFSTYCNYNPTNGTLATQKNHKQQVTSYSYDGLYRISGIQNPDGTTESTSFSWTSGGTNGLYCVSKSGSGAPTSKTYYDALNRETRSSMMRFNGVELHKDVLYDSYSRLEKSSLPFTGSAPAYWDIITYDSYDRPVSTKEASGKQTSIWYNGLSNTTSNDGIISIQTYDTQGNVISISDPAGLISYNLRPDGQPSSITAPGNVTTSFTYDAYGRKSSIVDPSAGTQSYLYDAAGNVSKETDANGKAVAYSYDNYNRLTSKVTPEFSTSYVYNQDGFLSSETSGNGTSKTFTYDVFGRLGTEKESAVDSKWVQKTYSYANGNLSSILYNAQSGSITTENYLYTNGHLTEIKLNGSTSIWKLTAENAMGQPTNVTTGSFSRSYGYTAYGLPTSRTAGTFQNFSYSFDAVKGNLTYRKDGKYNIQENFGYDGLNRLVEYRYAGALYDVKGNLTKKTDIGGDLFYNTPGKPYAISGLNNSSGKIPQRSQTITYTSFKRPNSITEGGYIASFIYNGGNDRVKMEIKNSGSSQLRRYYLGGRYELDEGGAGTKEKLYLGGDAYSAPAVYVRQNGGAWQIYYICRDYLGSITHITNSSGSLVQELSYDAWGRRQNPAANQAIYPPGAAPELFLGRGYTGHEHLAMFGYFGLINMNARLYDPTLGRFLSPDPYVQAPNLSQNFNRYSYCLNNPLRYTDQDGEFIHIVIGAVIGGIANLAYKAYNGQINSWGDGFAAFGIGAAAGAIGAATGGIAFAAAGGAAGGVGGLLAGAVAGAAGSAFMMPVQSVGNAFYFGDPLMTPKEYAIGIGLGALAGGLTNGAIAALKGNNFWTGQNVALGRGVFSFSNTPKSAFELQSAPSMEPLQGKPFGVDAPAGKAPFNAEIDQLPNNAISESYAVTPEGVALPKDIKYQIPADFIDANYNFKMPNSTSYGKFVNGEFKEFLRIDAATNPGLKGPNVSHYHLNGSGKHYYPGAKSNPGFGLKIKF